MPNAAQVERAEKHLMESRRELAGRGEGSSAQKASSLMFKSFEDSLKLFVESIRYQDPMDPVDTSEMAKQMFQLSQAQGMHSMNEKLEQQIDMMRSAQVLSTSGLIGKVIELDTNQFALEGEEKVNLSFDLPREVSKAKLEIVDHKGGTVFEKEFKPNPGRKTLEAGKQRIQWGGEVNTAHGTAMAKGENLSEGKYRIKVTIFDGKGNKILDPYTDEPISLPTTVKARLKGSDFSQKVPKLMIGSDISLPLSSIVSIQEDGLAGNGLVNRVGDLNDLISQLPEDRRKDAKKDIKALYKETRKQEKKADKFEKRVNNLTPKQFADLKKQLEEQLEQ